MCGGGGYKAPAIPEPTPVPATPAASEAVTAREHEERRTRRARGTSSTILTSGLGVGTEATTSKPTLLGQ